MPIQRVVVAGLGVSGRAAAASLIARGDHVLVVEGRDGPAERDAAGRLRAQGVEVRLGDAESPVEADLIVVSPGWRPDQPLLAAAHGAGIEVIGEPELAWRLRPTTDPAPWLGVTGTNGKTTTVGMVAAALQAGGRRAVAAGNVGLPLVDAINGGYDVIAVELSSFQLHWSSTLECAAASILNVADDHRDWHGSFAAYAEAKAAVLRGDPVAVVNLDDAMSVELSAATSRQVGFTTGEPASGQYGVRNEVLVTGAGEPIVAVADLPAPGPHNISNALAAAALAGAVGVPAAAVGEGLIRYAPGPHRHQVVVVRDGVTWVDDSKATNPHAAQASLAAYDSVVWIAGGLLKGADVEPLVEAVRPRLRAVVLIGRDRDRIADALARHAPDVPVEAVTATDTEGMVDAVRIAAGFARPGDTVLLAPAAASMDMFRDYAERGDRFAAAAQGVAGHR
jgi:UDP-N-acetylmuramoylalanine--D-glutamate ligase